MNVESATATLLMRTRQEPAQPARPQFTTDHLNAWFELNATVNEKVSKREVEIKRILKDTGLTREGQQKRLAALVGDIMKEFEFLADALNKLRAARSRLMHLILDPITAKPKDGDPMVVFLREQELRRTIPKAEAHTAFLRALEGGDLETARAILDAPGAPWVSEEVRRRGEDAYAARTDPTTWRTVQALTYYQDHVESLIAQVRQWFLALGASPTAIHNVLGD